MEESAKSPQGSDQTPPPPPPASETPPPPPASNHAGKNKQILTAVVGIVAAVVVAGGVLLALSGDDADKATDNKTNNKANNRTIKGLVVSRSNYVANCKAEAIKGDRVTGAQADSYCGCVYDKGVQRYGGEEFTKKNVDVEKSGQLTPELNQLVNDCVANLQ